MVRSRTRASGLAFYTSAVLPSRAAILEITTEIDDVHSRQLADGESRMAAGFASMRLELLWAFVLSLVPQLFWQLDARFTSCGWRKRLDFAMTSRPAAPNWESYPNVLWPLRAERKSISRELHDEVGQTLNALLVDAGNLQKRIPESDAQSRELLDSIRRLADTSINEVRDIALLLRLRCWMTWV